MSTTATVELRDEVPTDVIAIRALTQAAFLDAPHRSGTEQFIIDALRREGALSASVVALRDGVIVGHAAASPVTIDGHDRGWHGLGPVSVIPDLQGQGIGRLVVDAVLSRLRTQDAAGCVVLSDPAYYGRFGFRALPQLRLPGVPCEYFQSLPFSEGVPKGDVAYSNAFDATA